MKIDYKKYDELSEITKNEILDFTRMLVNQIELFGKPNENQATVPDFGKGNFDLPKLAAMRDKLNAVLGDKIIELPRPFVSGCGPRDARRLTTDLIIDYKPNTLSTLRQFLKKVDVNLKAANYITEKNGNFYYKGLPILVTKKNSDYYKVFCALYDRLSNGGEIPYKDLIAEIKSRMPEQKNKTDDQMRSFIQAKLTAKGNGFLRNAKIPKTEDNGKPLISVIRSYGISFNNKTG